MMVRPFDFFGGVNYQESEAHEILNNFFDQILDFFKNQLRVNVEDYSNINELVYSQPTDSEASYFWNWMKNTGMDLINKIVLHKLSQADEFLDLLDHRIYVLEVDIDSGLKDSVYHSFAESLKAISELQEIINQSAAAKDVSKIGDGTIITEMLKSHTNPLNGFIWVDSTNSISSGVNWKNPAENQQGFCYYLDKE